MPDLQTVRGSVSDIKYLRTSRYQTSSSPPATATAVTFTVGEQPVMAVSSSGNEVRSDLPIVKAGDDVEIAGAANSRTQWLEATRVHNHTTGATWELNLRRAALGGCLPFVLTLLTATAVLVL